MTKETHISNGKVDTPSATQVLVRQLADDITSGKLVSGDPLPPERELMTSFAVSRTVVREAISALSARGLVESRPRYRPIVRGYDFDTSFNALSDIVSHLLLKENGARTLYDVRMFFEAALVRHAVTHARREHIAELRATMKRSLSSLDDHVAFDNADVDFHAVFYAIPGNPVFPAIQKAFVKWLYGHWQSMGRSRADNLVSYEGHVAIFNAVTDRDADAAAQALVAHLSETWGRMSSTFTPNDLT
ncbi:MAG: FadR family transcriptional regulator [Alphaproteobacteria bacterium]|nr:FadR family transcriptional regulator [Alphaproteobacteria bacterium]